MGEEKASEMIQAEHLKRSPIAADRLDDLERENAALTQQLELREKHVANLQTALNRLSEAAQGLNIKRVNEREDVKAERGALKATNAKLERERAVWETETAEARRQSSLIVQERETFQAEASALKAKVAELEARNKQLGTALGTAQEAAMADSARQEQDAKHIATLEARVKKLEHTLEVILPMAKGYAHEHQVGRNLEKIAWAEALIAQEGEHG